MSEPADLQLTMRSRPRLLAAARAMIGQYAQRLGYDEVECGQISLAVDEAVCNIIKHGYESRDDGQIWITCRVSEESPPEVTIILEDEARQVDPDTIRSRDLDDIRPGGLGVFIMREVMDEVVFERREKQGMRLIMRKRLPNAVPAPQPEGESST